MQKNIWLSISLFSSKNNWSSILNKGIIPFLDKLSAEGESPSFMIEFNHLRGENIRFSLSTPEAYADSLSASIDSYFKEFFSRSVGARKGGLLPTVVTDLFMPFTENTIQYGLYNSLKDNGDERVINLKIALSAIMLEALTEEDINDNGLDTFAFYLTISLLYVTGKNACVSEKRIIEFYKKSISEKTDDVVHSEFIKNKESLAEIVYSITSEKGIEKWLSNWELSLGKILVKATDIKEILCIYDLVSSLIYKQLDVTGHRKIILHYFIYQLMLTDLKNEIFKNLRPAIANAGPSNK